MYSYTDFFTVNMTYTVVLFVHNTVAEYHPVSYSNVVDLFVHLAYTRVKERADLDCRKSFISYSDDDVMVQLIGPITNDLTTSVINAINSMQNSQRD